MAAPINMTKERTNFLGATDIVLDEIPKRLRLYFVEMWNYKYPEYPWENTPSNGEMFFNGEHKITLTCVLYLSQTERCL